MVLTPHMADKISKSEDETSDLIFLERMEWRWLKHDEGFDFE